MRSLVEAFYLHINKKVAKEKGHKRKRSTRAKKEESRLIDDLVDIATDVSNGFPAVPPLLLASAHLISGSCRKSGASSVTKYSMR